MRKEMNIQTDTSNSNIESYLVSSNDDLDSTPAHSDQYQKSDKKIRNVRTPNDVILVSCSSIPSLQYSTVAVSSDRRNKNCCGDALADREPLAAWLLLVRGILYAVLLGFTGSIFGILYVPYTEVFQATKSQVGWIDSLMILSVCVTSMFISWPMEQLGNPKVAFGMSLVGFLGLTLSALAPSLPMLYVTQGILGGVGVCHIPVIVAIQLQFKANRTLANGLMMMGLSIGALLGPYLVEYLYQEYGWRGCILLMAAITFHKAPLGLTFWPPQSSTLKEKEKSHSSVCKFLLNLLKESLDFQLLCTNNVYLLFTIGSVIQNTFTTAIFSHQASFAVYRGMTLKKAAFIYSLSFITAMSTRPLMIVVSNLRCTNKMLQYTIGNAIGCLAVVFMVTVEGETGLILASASVGLCIALTYTIHSVLLVEIVGLEKFGKALGLLHCLCGLIEIGATPLCGWIYDLTGWYELAFIVIGIWQACGALLFLVITIHLCFKPTNLENEDIEDVNYEEEEQNV